MPRNAVLIACLALCLIVSAIDVYTDIEMLILYLMPILIASWYGGPREGYVIAIYASIAAEVSIALTSQVREVRPEQLIPLSVHFAIFVILARVVSQLRTSRSQQKQLTEFVVHDLRSPIASSITGLQTLATLSDNMDELQLEMVDLALVSNQRALTLVNSILDISKMEGGSMEVTLAVTDLREMLEESIRQVALWAQGSDVKMELELGVERAKLDADLTSRVVVNLLSNALKFSPAGAIVKIKTELVGTQVKFTVKDQGPGIPAEYVETIFEPFAQVKGTRGGTGLGLTFCRLAVHAQGGRIWIESQLGKGTSMIFLLGSIDNLQVN